MDIVLGLAVGAAFGAALFLAALADPDRIVGTLRFRDFHAMRVIAVFVLAGMAGTYLLSLAGLAHLGVKPAALVSVFLGGCLVGAGLGLTGYCPGTGLACAAAGRTDALFGVLGMLAGGLLFIILHPAVAAPLDRVMNLGKVTLPEVTGVPAAVFVVVFCGAGAAVLWLSRRAGRAAPVVLLFLLAGAGCAATEDRPATRYSGFLPDYAEMSPSADGEFLVWSRPGLSLAKYRSILLDPPEIWLTEETRAEVGTATIDNLIGYAERSAREALGARFALAAAPGPDVLRLRWALTELRGANPYLTPIAHVVPYAGLANEAVNLIAGERPFVGGITVEAEVLDGGTGERLITAVDRRVGTNAVTNLASTWGDVKDAFDYWAKSGVRRLDRAGLPPKP
ncbi:MAG: DUF3313 family protein [Planctomycetes bacterium]|jgi:hypothetical protein|nr:DUF3313 family protein [Planctomycetota bacterium]